MAEALSIKRSIGYSTKAQEKFLRQRFLQARSKFIELYQWQKLALPKNRTSGNLVDHERAYQRAFDSYMAHYASNHDEASTRARRAFLESETGYLKRVYAAQHMLGKATGKISQGVMWGGRKVEAFAASRSTTVRESPLARKAIRFLAMGAMIAAATVAILHFFPTLTAAIITKRLLAGGAGYLVFKYLVPLTFSHSAFFQRHPKGLVAAREILGWLGFGVGWLASYEISGGMMSNLHMKSADEHLDDTMRNIGVYQIDQARGAPMFMPIDSSSDGVLNHAVNTVATAYDARFGSPDLNQMYANLNSLQVHHAPLLNTANSRVLVGDGVKIMDHLRILEESRLHGGDQGYGVFKNVSQELQAARTEAHRWNLQFEQAAQAAGEENHKNTLQIGLEYLNTHPQQPLPPLNTVFLSHNPAHLFAEVPIADPNAVITAGALLQSETIIHARLQTIEDVLHYYTSIINPKFNPHDSFYDELLSAQKYFQDLSTHTHSVDGLFASLPRGHIVVDHAGAPSGTDLTDLQIRDSIHHIDFSQYENAWNAVRAANTRAEHVLPGHTFINGKDVTVPHVIPFKEGAFWKDLTPFMNNALTEAQDVLNKAGVHLHVTEGWKIGYDGHLSGCHRNGTCVDLAPVSGKFTGRDIYKIFSVLPSHAKRLLLESNTPAGVENLKADLIKYLTKEMTEKHYTHAEAMAWMQKNTDIEIKLNATGDNLHFEPIDGQPVDPVVVQ